MIPKTVELIKKEEGFRPKAYPDSKGHQTIGYGLKISALELDREEAEFLTTRRVRRLEQDLEYTLAFLNGPRRAVLVSMAYQMGRGGLLSFRKMLRALHDLEYEKAADEMLDSKWAREDSPVASRVPPKESRNCQLTGAIPEPFPSPKSRWGGSAVKVSETRRWTASMSPLPESEVPTASKKSRPAEVARRRRPAPFPVKLLQQVIGAARLMAAPYQLQHPAPKRGQPHPPTLA